MNRVLASLLALTLLIFAVAPPVFVPNARANDWRLDLNTLNLCVIGEGDPDTPDLTGMNYKVMDREGNVVDVDQAWLLQVLMATFGNWFALIN